jgi:hypothetical protein
MELSLVTLFAALNTLNGTVVGRCMPRHTHKEFIKCLAAVGHSGGQGHPCHSRYYFTRTGLFEPQMILWCERFRVEHVIERY